MIVCVTPNAAIDLTMQLDALRIGAVQRAAESIAVAGGKGVNVARVARLLGGASTNAAFLGGAAGRYFAELAQAEGLRGRWTWAAGETRTCVMLAQPQHGDATVVNGQGMRVDDADWQRFRADVLAHAAETAASTICLCGSLPPGSAAAAYAELLRGCVASGRRVWVDTSGEPLRAALSVPGVAVKVNRAELMDALRGESEMAFGTLAEVARSAQRLIAQRGLAMVAVTLGGEGAVLATAQGAWAAAAPVVPLVSSVGSGDSTLAATALAFERGADPGTALRCGVAAGTANAMSLGGGRFAIAEYEDSYERIHVVALA